jgi:hypothetical protein
MPRVSVPAPPCMAMEKGCIKFNFYQSYKDWQVRINFNKFFANPEIIPTFAPL